MSDWQHHVDLQDIDAAGVVFCGHFADWAHRAYERECALAEINLLQFQPLNLPIKQLSLTYHAPVFHGNLITAEIRRVELRQRSFELEINLLASQTICCSVRSIHCCVNAQGELAPLPEEIVQMVKQFPESCSAEDE